MKNTKKYIRQYVEWQQMLEGIAPIKRWRRPIAKLKYNYWKLRNAIFPQKQR